MSHSKFPKILDYHALKEQFGDDCSAESTVTDKALCPTADEACSAPDAEQAIEQQPPSGLTGSRLRSYAFAVLTRREYSKADLTEKLAMYAASREEVIALVNELARENYQSDRRVAEMMLASHVRRGKGPNRIKLALRSKQIDKTLIQQDLSEIDWYEQAYQLKIRKYGTEVTRDPRLKAKQIRFLQYRGFDMDAIMKAITRQVEQDCQ
ncbi:regulatory protein RecX [Acinetobacter sp. WZC-1]|uniref:regulatory protein RecX n=1 Tax=Acinetobacter sp. WZC-1 TaxID=3459034 RepID=UPI00403DF74A